MTAVAASPGCTRSAVSRQIAAIAGAAGAELLERRREGVRPTAAARVVMRRATTVPDENDATVSELSGLPEQSGTVRPGWFPSAGTVLLPMARSHHPARVRRAGRHSGARLLASVRPGHPRGHRVTPPALQTLGARALRLAVPAAHPLAHGDFVEVADLRGQRLIASAGSGQDRLLGTRARPRRAPPGIAHTARDWPAEPHLVAADRGPTGTPAMLAPAAPPGVRVLRARGRPPRRGSGRP